MTAPDATVPASTSIRRRSVPNSSTDRLGRRLEYLRSHLACAHEWAEQKSDFRHRVVEVLQIEAELARRGADFRPVSRRPG